MKTEREILIENGSYSASFERALIKWGNQMKAEGEAIGRIKGIGEMRDACCEKADLNYVYTGTSSLNWTIGTDSIRKIAEKLISKINTK